MISHKVKVYPSKAKLIKKKQLAWKIAEIASDNAKLNKDSIDMVINRIIDNSSVAIASTALGSSPFPLPCKTFWAIRVSA